MAAIDLDRPKLGALLSRVGGRKKNLSCRHRWGELPFLTFAGTKASWLLPGQKAGERSEEKEGKELLKEGRSGKWGGHRQGGRLGVGVAPGATES